MKLIKIKEGQRFQLGSVIYTHSLTADGIKLKKEGTDKAVKPFIPPSLADVEKFFSDKGYTGAKMFFDYYENSEPKWHKKNGEPVRAWKQTAITYWMKEENKIGDKKDENGKYSGMVF